MSLRIDLDDKKTVWHPGDTVSGVVSLVPSKHVNVELIKITLDGDIGTMASDRDRLAQGDIRLFRKEDILFRGPYTLASAQEWRFTLCFPEDCRLAVKHGISTNPILAAWLSAEQSRSLPPSSSTANVPFAPSSELYGCIKYHLHAEVALKGVHTNIQKWISLDLVPYRDELMRDPTPEHVEVSRQRLVKSLHLDPGMGERSLSVKERLKTTFATHKIPSLLFNIAAEFPDRAILGEAPHILLSVHSVQPAQEKTMPQVELKSLDIYVIRKIGYRSNSSLYGMKSDGDLLNGNEEVRIVRWSGSIDIEGRLDLRELYQSRASSGWKSVVPDYSAFHYHENHSWKLKLEIEVAKQVSEVILPGPPFKVLSPYCRPAGNPNANVQSSYVPVLEFVADDMEGDLSLPPYEQHSRDEPIS